MVLVHLQPMVSVIVCHAIATDGGVGGVLDHGLYSNLCAASWCCFCIVLCYLFQVLLDEVLLLLLPGLQG